MLTILIFVLVLGVLVFVHELGHFVVARMNGIKADEFGFGFPPRIGGIVKDDATGRYRFVRGNTEVASSHTVYSLNWIPLGGFVKIKGEDRDSAQEPDSFAGRSAWTRIRVLGAGVVMNFLLAWFLFSVVLMIGFPEQVDPEKRGSYATTSIQILQVQPHTPADEIGLKAGDVIQTLDAQPVTSLDFVSTYIREHRGGLKGMFQKLKSSMEEWKKHYETNKQSRDFASVMPSSGKTISIDDVNEYLKNYKDQHSINIIDQLPEISQIIFNMKWSIWKNKNNNFVTCDNPLYLIRPASIKKYGTNVIGSQPGLLYNDVELTVPLASGRLLLAGWILEQDSYFEVDDDLAEKMNHRTICSSSERIITNSKEKAEMIKNKYTETAYKQARKA